MTDYPQLLLDAAAKAAHRALAEVDDGWHYTCTQDPDDQSCGKGYAARRMLAEDVMPAVLAVLEEHGALSATDTPITCKEETWSGEHFNTEQTDGYWITCDLQGPHDQHRDEHTGLTWVS